MKISLARRSVAELISTFCLILMGCGAIVVNQQTETLTHVGVAISWGLIVLIMIYAVGGISGAHMNPAVTIAFAVSKRLPIKDACAYVPAQCAGAVLAAAALRVVLGNDESFLGSTTVQNGLTPLAGLAIETMMTAILMFVVMGVSTGAKEETITAGIAVGCTIGLEAFVAGPLTAASMNPARSLGPALVSGMTTNLWLYIAGPVAGALIGYFAHQAINQSVD